MARTTWRPTKPDPPMMVMSLSDVWPFTMAISLLDSRLF
jgi:hypothetical protein